MIICLCCCYLTWQPELFQSFSLKSKGTLEDEMVARIPFCRSGANYLKLRENKFE